jgi:putative flippase GtrA
MLVGVANTLFSMFLMFAFEGLGFWPSTAIAYIASSVLSFFLNRSFTFHSDESIGKSAVKFAINVAICYVVAYSIAQPVAGWLFSKVIADPLWIERLTKLFGMCLFTVLNYFGQRYFAFNKK